MRRRIGYSIRRSRRGIFNAYIFSHGEIKKGCPRGIWQFDMVTYAERKIPHLFFTCPVCGKINKDYVNVDSFMRGVRYIEYCHNCRFCGVKLPFSVEGGLRKIQTEYRKIMERAGLGDRKEGDIDGLYIQFVESMMNGALTDEGKRDLIRSYRMAFQGTGYRSFNSLLETVRSW